MRVKLILALLMGYFWKSCYAKEELDKKCDKKNLNIRKYVMTIFNEAPQNLVIEMT